MDTKKLRQKILDLAIRGKLVPQDPNDEPASVLLERIRAEKQQLIKEGKIKAPKGSKACDTSHYEKVEGPFEIPESWEWCRVADIANSILYGVSESAKPNGRYKLLRITDIQENKVDWDSVPFTNYDEEDARKYLLNDGDILFARTGATVGKSYLVSDITYDSIYASYLIRIQTSKIVSPEYVKRFFESGYYWEQISSSSVGVGQPNVNGTSLGNLLIPIPPFDEQKRIVLESEKWFTLIESIDKESDCLSKNIERAKSLILNLAITGKLVPQDSSDEPAIELLRRINPDFKPCDNSHYENLPEGWTICKLEEILEYEQPQQYIVESTEYSDEYETPVLTPGKSFILGYTNEAFGVYYGPFPVIIFDDFTTASKLVDFPFKVKSSAMKILHPAPEIDVHYVQHFMSITRLTGNTHKRYWISEYSKVEIPIPPSNEQNRIVSAINEYFTVIDTIETLLI